MIIPAISLHQPWASFLAWGVKGPESSGWKPPAKYIGKPILIHAAKRPLPMIDEVPDNGTIRALELAGRTLSDLKFGCILGVGTLAGVYRSEDVLWAKAHLLAEARLHASGDELILSELEYTLGNYEGGRYAWVFEDLREIPEPIPYRGMQGFFNVELPDEIAGSLGLIPCRKCGGQMKPGKALRNTASGSPDFLGDGDAVTLSMTGPCEMIECMKCRECGWSATA